MPMRFIGVLLIAASLAPFRARPQPAMLLILLYVAAGFSYGLAAGFIGVPNDQLFFNTVIQLPVLFAASHTRWRIDEARWLRFIGHCLIAEAAIDTMVLFFGQTLWISQAFVGGFGNPSSFGLSCVLLSAFFLFHPRAGRLRGAKAIVLAIAALMTKSLFSALSVLVIAVVWATQSWRRFIAGSFLFLAAVGGGGWYLSTLEHEAFLIHKLNAAGAFIGLVDYDTDSSATVSVRSEMHATTFNAIADDPASLVIGHLGHRVYWPIDSQVLTYLGSFGVGMLFLFLMLHVLWVVYAFRHRKSDGKFSFVALGLFGLIFFTNRILDYFPVATLYFICIAMATRSHLRPSPASVGRQEVLRHPG